MSSNPAVGKFKIVTVVASSPFSIQASMPVSATATPSSTNTELLLAMKPNSTYSHPKHSAQDKLEESPRSLRGDTLRLKYSLRVLKHGPEEDSKKWRMTKRRKKDGASMRKPLTFSMLPYDVAIHILSFLEPKDLCQAAQVCKSWRNMCDDTRLWKPKFLDEELMDDDQALNCLFYDGIRIRDDISKIQGSDWRRAYLKHISITNNWRTRKFDFSQVSDELISDGIPWTDLRKSGDFCKKPNIIQVPCHEDAVITCLQFNPETNTIVTGSDDSTLKIWSSQTGRLVNSLQGHTGGVWSSQLDDNYLISGSTDRTVRVWNAKSGKLIHALHGHTSTVRCLALDGGRVVSGSRDTTLRLWNVETGSCVHVFLGHSNAVRCVEFKNDTIVSGAYDFLVMVWDANTGHCRHVLDRHMARIYSLQFDGKTIASGSLDSTICIWDAETGNLRHQLMGHTSLTSKMQLKGNMLVSANADSYCKVWDIKNGKCLHTLGGASKHTSAMTSVYFNSRNVITSSDDGTIKLWDMKTGKFIRNLLVLPTAGNRGVIWRIRGSYTKLICAAGSRGNELEDTQLLILDLQ